MPFRAVSLTMVQNEADVVEYFVRANLRLLDHMVVAVNPSSDGTAELLDALAEEGLPVTVWRVGRNHYAQGEMLSWLALQLRDQLRPGHLFLLDADEILLAGDRAALDAALEAIPPGSVGVMPWRSFLPRKTVGARFDPEDFGQRLSEELDPTVKLVIPAATVLHPEAPLRHGLHKAHDPQGAALASAPVRGVEIAHLPVRSFAQIREKTVAGLLARALAQGTGWMGHQSHQRSVVWNMLQQPTLPDIDAIAAGYLNRLGLPLPEVVPDDRLPRMRLTLNAAAPAPDDDELYLRLSRRLYWSAFPLPNPVDALDPAPEPPSKQEARDRSGLPAGAFAAAQHARVLKCDWPPLEQAANRFRPACVLDLGCGLGAYLRLFAERGVQVRGVDGAPWTNYSQIPESAYRQHDLSAGPPGLDESFDLSICLEVLEHLPEPAGLEIVTWLAERTRTAIVFSAAQPGQPGDGHITCRPPDFWLQAFERCGWTADPAASAALRLTSTLFWFQRNLFVLRAERQADPEGLSHLLELSQVPARWPGHGPGRTFVGFAGERPSFARDGAREVPVLPAYQTEARSRPLWRRGLGRLRREVRRLAAG